MPSFGLESLHPPVPYGNNVGNASGQKFGLSQAFTGLLPDLTLRMESSESASSGDPRSRFFTAESHMLSLETWVVSISMTPEVLMGMSPLSSSSLRFSAASGSGVSSWGTYDELSPDAESTSFDLVMLSRMSAGMSFSGKLSTTDLSQVMPFSLKARLFSQSHISAFRTFSRLTTSNFLIFWIGSGHDVSPMNATLRLSVTLSRHGRFLITVWVSCMKEMVFPLIPRCADVLEP